MLGRRRDHEHEAVTSMKTEFMQLWDGFLTDSFANVMVLAATNRPYDLDEAILRRHALGKWLVLLSLCHHLSTGRYVCFMRAVSAGPLERCTTEPVTCSTTN